MNRDIAEALLTQAGHSVDMAANGAEAVAAVTNNDYDLVLMDIQMPVMDGFEATARIRSLPAPKRSIPIVAMTAYATRQDIQHCVLLGNERPYRQADRTQDAAGGRQVEGDGTCIGSADGERTSIRANC